MKATYTFPPNIQAAMTGTRYAFQVPRSRSITLVYEDGSTETREGAPGIRTFDNYFALVDWVQEPRVKA